MVLEALNHSESSFNQSEYLYPEKGKIQQNVLDKFCAGQEFVHSEIRREPANQAQGTGHAKVCSEKSLVWRGTQLSSVAGGLCAGKSAQHRRRPEVGRLWPTLPHLAECCPSYFFRLYPEYFFSHLHVFEDHHFLRDPAHRYSEILSWLHSCVLYSTVLVWCSLNFIYSFFHNLS